MAAGILAAIAGGAVATAVSLAVTDPGPAPIAEAPAPVTVTATPAPPVPPVPPAPLPAAQADAATCKSWAKTVQLISAAEVALSVIPDGTTITSPGVEAQPTWVASINRAADIFDSAATQLGSQIAAGTSPILSGVAETTAATLRTAAVAYRTRDPQSGEIVTTLQTSHKAMGRLCP